jgi:branched-chain amino acid transport system ATP-binding protein
MILRIEDVHTYYGSSYILQGLSLEMEAGEIVCLIGRNGAGKTTTMRTIIGLTPPRRGHIKFKGQEITNKSPFLIVRMGMGYVPEDRRIFPLLTARDNLEIAKRKITHEGVSGWTIDKIYDFFPRLKDLENHLGTEMSGGEQQMLAMARALMGNPELLLVDEPTQGLAPIIVQSFVDLIRRLKEEMSILLVEQNVLFAFSVSVRGYVIDKGKILYQGGITDLRENEDVQKRYLAV